MGIVIEFNGVQHSPYLDIANIIKAIDGFYTSMPELKPDLVPEKWYPRFFYNYPQDPYLYCKTHDGKVNWSPWEGIDGEERMIEFVREAFDRYIMKLSEKGDANRRFYTREPNRDGEIITSFNMKDITYKRYYIVDINEFLNLSGISSKILCGLNVEQSKKIGDSRSRLKQYYNEVFNYLIDVTDDESIDRHVKCIINYYNFIPLLNNVIKLPD
ncbi:MAG: hypothetical protein SVZ03_11830 [Spirochaetota bacterium]|nr:hypothetical protein [Spirochaetota bacterium]